MIKCNIKRGSNVLVSSKGQVGDLIPETLLLIQQIYLGIKNQNPEAAEQYKLAIIGGTLDPNSLVWKDGAKEEASGQLSCNK